MKTERKPIDQAIAAGMDFYTRPDELRPEQVDPLLRDIVFRVNRSGWVWTAESCQGHPDSRDHAPWADNTDPMLRLVCFHEDLGPMLGVLLEALYDCDHQIPFWRQWVRMYPTRRQNGWTEVLVYLNGQTAYYRDQGIRVLERFSELLSIGYPPRGERNV